MKNSYIVFLLLCFIPDLAHAEGFNSVFSNDGIHVWAAGNAGNLFYSLDGGNTWNSSPAGIENLNSVFSVNQRVWIVGDNGTFRMSTNGGMSWLTYTLSSVHLNSVFFVDQNNGWIVGNSGTILRTTNGGGNWLQQTSPVTQNLNSVSFTSSANGIACGASGKVIYWNGSLWQERPTPTSKELLSIDRKGTVIIATAVDGITIKSTNDGVTWSIVDYKIVTKSDINSVSMVAPDVYYTCGGGGFIRRTTDGGATNVYQENPMMADLVSIFFYDADKGWAVSSKNNAVLRTTNGGSTWLLPQGTSVTFTWVLKQSGTGNIGNGFCLHPFNKNTIFIAMGNRVYRSLDRGDTWSQVATISPGSRAHTFFISQVDTNYMIASMDESAGRVVRSTNYGQTWSVVWGPGALTSYGMPMQLDWNTPNLVYLNPDNSQLLKSSDFGLNWNFASAQVFRSPDEIEIPFESPNVIYIGDGITGVGNAELFRTTNAGLNWVLIHSVSGSEIPMIGISSLDNNLAYHSCWSSGGIWKTTDRWNTYQQVASTTNAWAVDIAKDDPTTVAYGVYASQVYISTNSGISFVQTNTGSSPEAGMYFYDKGNLLSQKGGGVYKLSVNYSVPLAVRIVSSRVPDEFSLLQNYPNPFNSQTKFKIMLPEIVSVRVVVYDITGREMAVLVNQQLKPGTYEIGFNAASYPSGVYLYRLIAGDYSETRKMILAK